MLIDPFSLLLSLLSLLLAVQPHIGALIYTLAAFSILVFCRNSRPSPSTPALPPLLAVAIIAVFPFRVPELLGTFWFLIGGHLKVSDRTLVRDAMNIINI